ncbi:MAG: hypothetical protein ABSE08_10020 [Syntrophobacteraceae bacterium]|jgi:hypothetical protein
MLLKIGGCELEIIRGKFVCFSRNNGETSYFSNWRDLDRELQEKFEAMREELSEVMQTFANSKHNALFEAISEEYKKKDQPECSV